MDLNMLLKSRTLHEASLDPFFVFEDQHMLTRD